uniref:Xanthine dehydrogenase family protein molybdopterin-binding subunit n=1 Tax=Acidicaldus sp. TaxID=1872105 RepID=A0A8J4M527_9PROT
MTHIEKNSPPLVENVSRRGLLKGVVASGSLIVATTYLPKRAMAAWATGAGLMPHGTVSDPHVFVAIAKDGIVTIVAHRSEMGTGSKTSLPMVVADEMGADWSRCRVVQAPGDEVKYGNQDTDGSRSLRHFVQPMRQCGAAARLMLEMAAAERWGVDVSSVEAVDHAVVHRDSGRRLGFGDLAEAAAALPTPAPDKIRLKDTNSFRYIGTGSVPIVDLFGITTGTATYGADIRLPGMKYAVIARPPVLGAKVKSFDGSAALKVPGVEKVVEVQGWDWPAKFQPVGGVAVIARNTGVAIKGRDALKITWTDSPHAVYNSDSYREMLLENARKPGKTVRNDGDIDGAMKSAAKTITAEYYIPQSSHAPMEPPVATAWVHDGMCEVWAPVQSPGGTHDDLVKTLGLSYDKVKVNVTLLGGAFGRKSKCDFVLEAALLSKTLNAPVRVQWTREDDIQHDFYHAVAVERIEAALDANNKVIGWRHRNAAPSLFSTFMPDPKMQQPLEYSMGQVDLPFAIENIRCEVCEAPAHSRIGWFRSVRNVPNTFATQSFVAELAHATGRDPKDMLLELIGAPRIVDPRKTTVDLWNYGDPFETYPIDTGRLRGVVELVAEKAGWGRDLPAGHGMGIAVQRSFLSYIATVVEVAIDDKGNISVPRVDTAVDCGFHVNPERITSQIEGAAIMGLGIAKHCEITYKNGVVQQSNFNDYQVVRIDEAPRVTNVYIVPAGWDTPSSGVGEPGTPPFAPALCNAIFAATGKRIRNLPIGDQLAI